MKTIDFHLIQTILLFFPQFASKNVMTSDTQHIKDIFEWFRGTLSSRSLNECIMLINIGTAIEVYDEVILSHTFNLFLNDPQQVTALSPGALQIASRTLSLTQDPKNMETVRLVGHELLKEIKNRLDKVTNRYFHTALINIIRNLSRIDVYDDELMHNLFRKDYLQFMYGKNTKLELPLYEIDGYNRVNLKDSYRGNLMPDKYLESLRFLWEFIPDRVNRYKKRHRFLYAMEDAVGSLFVHYRYANVLPFHKHPGKCFLLSFFYPFLLYSFKITFAA